MYRRLVRRAAGNIAGTFSMQCPEYNTRQDAGRASMPFTRAQLDELLGLAEGGIRKLLELQQKYVEL
jgi:hypothetical protein